ncbi:MAG: restriction endonuclease subunit S [Bacteroidales bacterium]
MIATAIENTKTAWLGAFPAHWEVLRIKNLFHEMDSRSETGSEELLSVSHYTGVTLKRDSLENEDDHLTNAESLVGYKLVQQGDLVINIMLAWNGSLGISPYNGITSPAYCVYRIKGNNNPEYFGYLFSTNLFKAEFRRHSTGIIDSRLRLYSDKFFGIFSVVPPKHEQDQIVQFIKAQEEKINRFIEKKQRFIELLKEQRQSKIDEAIVKGINPNVKFKATKYDWLGSIPEHWLLRRLGTIGSFSKGGNISRAELVESGFPAILYGDIYTKYDIEAKIIINRIEEETAVSSVKIDKEDLLFTGSGETKEDIGKCVVFNGDDEVYVGGDVIIFKQSEFDSHFISYSQNSSFAKYQKAISSNGDIIVHTYGSKLRDVVMPYPPTIEEQKQIVAHIKTETATIDTAIAKAEREIELIREYKEALISEAVMGKRKLNFAH